MGGRGCRCFGQAPLTRVSRVIGFVLAEHLSSVHCNSARALAGPLFRRVAYNPNFKAYARCAASPPPCLWWLPGQTLLFSWNSTQYQGAATPMLRSRDAYQLASGRCEEHEAMVRCVPDCKTRKRLNGDAFPYESRIDLPPCQVKEWLHDRPIPPQKLYARSIIQLCLEMQPQLDLPF